MVSIIKALQVIFGLGLVLIVIILLPVALFNNWYWRTKWNHNMFLVQRKKEPL